MATAAKKRKIDDEELMLVDSNIDADEVIEFELDKNMFCWGSTIHGELGLGGIEEEHVLSPREVDFKKATEIEDIACGESHTIVVTRDGQVYSCGNNDSGQLGHNQSRKKLVLVPGLDTFVFKKASCGGCHTMAMNDWGQLFGWGSNSEGQLGLNSHNVVERVPCMVKSLGTRIIVQVACGLEHTLALTNNGELYAWGSNRNGQLGSGDDIRKSVKPRLVESLAAVPISFIACGGHHSIVVTKSGAVYGWGKNDFGQLGLNHTTNKSLPCQLRTLRNSKVRYVACGEEFTVFLTTDGGVFSCGAGMYGQLGHGSNRNEILPRQIMELMGSVVTQISCGKRHTLALVPSRGRVYAWGLGGAGQLGTRVTQSVTTPQVVVGPWVAPNGTAMITLDSNTLSPYAIDCVVKHVYSGGDHCFATVTPRKDNIKPDDFRLYIPVSQISIVTEEELLACQKVPFGAQVDHDLMLYLETVFKSQACINASFLSSNDSHYGSSRKNHGVDLDKATYYFDIISRIQNETINEVIFTSITESLIPSLKASPPDVESLRIYLTLPLYHGFSDTKNCYTLHKPFSKAVLNLQSEAKKIVGLWWSKAPKDYFEKLVTTYKHLVMETLKNPKFTENKTILWNSDLHTALDMLKFLSDLNAISEEKFYISDLVDCVNIKQDYFHWQNESEGSRKIFFCNYPFLFDTHAKLDLLETDQAIQMQNAVNQAVSRALMEIFMPVSNCPRQREEFVFLNVSRENIVADTLQELSKYDSTDLKKPLKVKFHNEEAEDAGGVKKEFFMLLLKEILDPKFGMFKEYEETNTIWFSEDSFEGDTMYFLIGMLCGLAIYNFIIINLPFPLALYKKLLNEKVSLSDINDISPVLARSLQSLLDYNESDLEEVFCLNFEVIRDVFGEKRVFELIPNGSKVPVTSENKQQFVDLYVDYILNKSVDKHFQPFNRGFHKVCGSRVLKIFRSHELMAVVIGNEDYDWSQLEENAKYKEGYTKDDPTIIMFWRIFHELPLEEKKKFLLFLTGSDRIPIRGMKAIKITIQPMSDDNYLPVAHTCFNLLDLPRYQTRERLRTKLLQAIQQTQGFSLV